VRRERCETALEVRHLVLDDHVEAEALPVIHCWLPRRSPRSILRIKFSFDFINKAITYRS
jgi:hypothetical protein